MTIPTDNVDPEQLRRPNHWDTHLIRRFMLFFGPIRTRRVPSLRSRPSMPLLASTLLVIAAGVALPFSRLAQTLGFTRLPATFLATVAGMIVVYLFLIELGKRHFYRLAPAGARIARSRPQRHRRIVRRAGRWSVGGNLVRVRTIRPGPRT